MVRFVIVENRSILVEDGVQNFDKKPIVVRSWKLYIAVMNDNVDKVMIWVQFVGLDIKYWGRVH